jgi:threonine/homoserine/homoserine lactone efflux protein
MLTYVLLGATYALAAAVQPGQFQAYLFSQAVTNGWRSTAPAAFSPLLSDIPVVCLVLFVLTHVPPAFVLALQLIGGAFLLYLAYGSFRSWRDFERPVAHEPTKSHETLLKAALVNLFNPNPYIAWSVVLGPLLLAAWQKGPANGIALVATFYATMIAGTLAVVALFALTRSFGEHVVRALVGVSAIALAAFGLWQLVSAISGIRVLGVG